MKTPTSFPYQPYDSLNESLYDEVVEQASPSRRSCPEVTALAEIKSRYTDRSLLGKGALKEVFKCFDLRTKRQIALAVPCANLGPEFYDIFLQEAWLTSALSHPNIIKIYDTGVDPSGRPFFTMTLKSNTTLKTLKESPAKFKELLVTFLKICDAISYAHHKGVIHLDLKPENIQCDLYGEVLVCDWGLAKKIGIENLPEAPTTEHLSQTQHQTLYGQVKGSLGYMAPEQVLPEGVKTTSTDIFALGCLLHYLILGAPPFQGSQKEVIEQTIKVNLEPAVQKFRALKVPKALQAIVLKALQSNPEDRYREVQELRNDLERHLDGFASKAERPNIFRKSALLVKRHRKIAGVVAAALLTVSSLSVLYFSKLLEKEKIISQEKGRADSLEEDVYALSEEYGFYADLPEWSKDKIAQDLVEHSTMFTRMFWTDDPVRATRENRELLMKIYEVQPDNPNLVGYLSRLDFKMMNFKSALSYPKLGSVAQLANQELIQSCPEYAFTESHRPTVAELCHFYREAPTAQGDMSTKQLSVKLFALMRYDWHVRESHFDYHHVFASFLKACNPDATIQSTRNNGRSSLSIESPQAFRSGVTVMKLNYHFYPYLEVDHLKLKLRSFELSNLDQSRIKSLDISEIQKIQITKPLHIHDLEEVIYTKKSALPKIKKALSSEKPYKFTRKKLNNK